MSDLRLTDGPLETADHRSTCPHCGSSIASDANFCPRCGTDLRAEESGGDSEQKAEQVVLPTAAVASLPKDDPPGAAKLVADSPWGLPKPVSQSPAKPIPSDEIVLFPSLSGLLEPLGVSGEWGDEILATAERRAAPVADGEELRQVRLRMLQEPTLAALLQPLPATHGVYRVRWIFGLLALALLMPFLLTPDSPTTASQPWAGAVEAYQAVQALPDGANVLLVWAYDPATAGEMDAVVYPLLRHLLRRRVDWEVITLLPGGAAMAQRLFARVVAGDGELAQNKAERSSEPDTLHFVAGGVTALPLIGAAICGGSGCGDKLLLDLATCSATQCQFALTVVVAAQAEDVQQWLEIAQPLSQVPVLAVTSAAADLPLRPYWNNQQLVGLVGGFDGAAAYLGKEMSLLGDAEWSQRVQALYDLRWGHFALIVIIFLANLVALGAGGSTNRRGEE